MNFRAIDRLSCDDDDDATGFHGLHNFVIEVYIKATIKLWKKSFLRFCYAIVNTHGLWKNSFMIVSQSLPTWPLSLYLLHLWSLLMRVLDEEKVVWAKQLVETQNLFTFPSFPKMVRVHMRWSHAFVLEFTQPFSAGWLSFSGWRNQWKFLHSAKPLMTCFVFSLW